MLQALIVALLAQSPAAAVKPATGPARPDACALIADGDVRAALGTAVTVRRPASHQARGLLLSQCYLDTGTPRSVSIAVAGTARSGGKTVTPRAFWREQFHRRDEDHERDGQQEENDAQARPIRGLGDEAFWSGTRVAGALYVLRGSTFIRVSVGGINDEKERIQKSRQLAAAALARLRLGRW